jgi:HemY protein
VRLFLFLLFASLAVSAAVSFANLADGEVIFRSFGYEIELSISVFAILQVFLAIFLYLVLKVCHSIFYLRSNIQEFFSRRRARREEDLLKKYLRMYSSGETSALVDKVREKLVEEDKILPEMLLIAAMAAHEEREYSFRDECLRLINVDGSDEDVLATRAKLLLDEGRHNDAIAALSRVKRKTKGILRARMQALRMGAQWSELLSLMPGARKTGVFDSGALFEMELESTIGAMNDESFSMEAVMTLLKRSDKRLKSDPGYVLAACKALVRYNRVPDARRRIELFLTDGWNDDLLVYYVEISSRDDEHTLHAVEQWLAEQPMNPRLLYVLGQLCFNRELWGKAESYFRAAKALDNNLNIDIELEKIAEISIP